MSGYGPLYWPWSCPIAVAGRADAISSNSTAVSLTTMVMTVTAADERILQTAAGEPEDQVVTCWATATVPGAATATVVVVAALLLWLSRVTTIIGHGHSAHAAGRVSSPNKTAFSNARAHTIPHMYLQVQTSK